jgi:hypothetical protein
VYLRARWYNPATGTFTSRDPFPGVDTSPQSLHPYAYTHNNPVNATDPSGKFIPAVVAVAALGALVIGVGAYVALDAANQAAQGCGVGACWGSAPFNYSGLSPAVVAPPRPPELVPVPSNSPDYCPPTPGLPRLVLGTEFIVAPESDTPPETTPEPDPAPSPVPGPVPNPDLSDECLGLPPTYGQLQQFDPHNPKRKRATWAKAQLCKPLHKGTSFTSGRNGTSIEGRVEDVHDRGHLIARELGGRGVRENGVPMYPEANQHGSRFRQIEGEVKAAVLEKNDIVYYSVTPIYDDSNGPNPVPRALQVVATGKTITINELVRNTR